MIAFRWGPAGRERVGYFHSRQNVSNVGDVVKGRAVLICNPFGQEALRAYRMLRILADRLAREGNDVLRFDYLGTGDSDGICESFDLDGAVEDILEADKELENRSSLKEHVWIGLRLGGSLSVRAASRRPEPLASVVLWDPIESGSDYLAELDRTNRAYIEYAFNTAWPDHVVGRRHERLNSGLSEALGFAVTDRLKSQLEKLTLANDARKIEGLPIGWLSDSLPRLVDGEARGLRWIPSPSRDAWNSDEAVFTARVPQEFIVACEQWVRT